MSFTGSKVQLYDFVVKDFSSCNVLNYLKFACRWWDCISLPDDVDYANEATFRLQVKELAFTVILEF